MGPGRLLRIPSAVAILVAALLSAVHAEEPSAEDLIRLAPVLDSNDRGCRSLDVSGSIVSEDDPTGPKLRFRALYRAPDRFALLITDPVDGTPLLFGSGRKMLIYDPIGPMVYYSEAAGMTMTAAIVDDVFKFEYKYFLKYEKRSRVFVDLRSIVSPNRRDAEGWVFEDRVVKHGPREFELIRRYAEGPHVAQLAVDVDLEKKCPYKALTFRYDGEVFFCLDRIALDEEIGDESFEFPDKERLARDLPLKDVTADDGLLATLRTAMIVSRANLARAFVHSTKPPGPIDLPRLVGVNWDRVKENDKKYSKTLRGLVPPILRDKAAASLRAGPAARPGGPKASTTTRAAESPALPPRTATTRYPARDLTPLPVGSRAG